MIRKMFMVSVFVLITSTPQTTFHATTQKSISKEEEIKKNIDSLTKETENSKQTKEKLQEQLTAAQQEILATQTLISELQSSIDKIELDILTTTATINRLETNIQNLNSEIQTLTLEVKKQEVILGSTISFLYETSDVTYLEFFFRSENLEELFNTHEFIQTIMDENDLAYQKILKARETLSTKKQEFTLSKLSLNTQIKDNQASKENLLVQQKALNVLLNSKQQEELAIFEQIKKEDMREQQASSTIVEYIQQLDYLKQLLMEDPTGINVDLTDVSFEASKALVTPLPGYSISSDFGMRFHPVLQQSRMHNGVDLGGKHGENIFSSGDGIVVFAGPAQGYGNWIVIYHGTSDGKDIYSIYGHMESNQITVQPKQIVKQGEVIGQVGNSGISTGPHLHFGVAEGFNGNSFNYVNPNLYMTFK